jgi:hypothetical protein
MGMNGQWAANTAQTNAKKQAMLETFNCSWPQPEDVREMATKAAKKAFNKVSQPESIGDAIQEYFDDFYQKKAKRGKKR